MFDARFEPCDAGVLLAVLFAPALSYPLFKGDGVFEHLPVARLDARPLVFQPPIELVGHDEAQCTRAQKGRHRQGRPSAGDRGGEHGWRDDEMGENGLEGAKMASSVKVWLVNPGEYPHEERREEEWASAGRNEAPGAAT